MQKVAAYLLERRDGLETAEARALEASVLRGKIRKWLTSKGADPAEASGRYDAEDGSDATFVTEGASDGSRSWSMVRLEELAFDGRCFAATISVTTTETGVATYASLEVGRHVSQISPLDADPKCPRIIRTLLGHPGAWYHGASRFRPLGLVSGFDDGGRLAGDILDPARTIPVVAVSEREGDTTFDGLDRQIAHDLAGLAIVVRLDADASWALTDVLGASFTCHSGAIRVYWPRFKISHRPGRHPIWTAQRLDASGEAPQVRERLRRKLRALLMRASATSVVRPAEIDAIRDAASRRALDDLREKANSSSDFAELAEAYARDNKALRAELEGQREVASRLQTDVENLKDRVAYAEEQLQHDDAGDDDIPPEPEPPAEPPPGEEEVRFYKKRFAAETHDVLVRVGDCGHNRWQAAATAEKAKKGVAKLEGRSDWKTLQHCGTCTGGGMWKVRW